MACVCVCCSVSARIESMQASSAAAEVTVPPLPAPPSQEPSEKLSVAASQLAVYAVLHAYSNSPSDGITEAEKQFRAKVVCRLQRAAGKSFEEVMTGLKSLLGSCSISFRACVSKDERVTRCRYMLIEAYRCKQKNQKDQSGAVGMMEPGDAADKALREQYGILQNVESFCTAVKDRFRAAFRLRSALVHAIHNYKLLLSGSGCPDTVTLREAVTRIDTNLHLAPEYIRSKFWKLAVKAYDMMRDAHLAFDRLKQKVDGHVAERLKSNKCFLSRDFLGDDLITLIAEHVGFMGAFSMLATSKSFANDATIKQLLPHLTVRSVDGRLAHGEQVVPGFGRCAVIRKNSHVHLYVDLVVTGLARPGVRTCGTRKHADKLCGWSADPAEQRRHRRLIEADAQERRFRTTDEVVPERGHFYARLSARHFFASELVCEEIKLVFADTHAEVVNHGDQPPIYFPHRMAVRHKRLHTYTARDGVPYPAYTTLCVTQRAARDLPRLYKFKVVARGFYRSKEHGGEMRSATLVAYSRPFAIVSNQHVFKRSRSPTET